MNNENNKRASGIVFVNENRILLLKRSETGKNPNVWDLPGGKSQDSETDLETAHREAKEELGIKEIPGKIFHNISHQGSQKKYTTFFYRVNQKFKIKLNKEHTEYGWFNLDELKSIEIHSKLNKNIENYMSKAKNSKTFSEWIQLRNNFV